MVKIGLDMCPNGYTSADADHVNHMLQLAMVAITSPLGTRDSFITELANQNVCIPLYFINCGNPVCSLH